MTPSSLLVNLLRFVLPGALGFASAIAATYHVDAGGGDDAADGLRPERAWRTLSRVNATTFQPGDVVLLRAGATWRGETLQPRGSGAPGAFIRIGAYGEGPRPVLHGDGIPAVVRLDNQQFWEIADLEITNTPPDGPRPVRGIEVRARDAGVLTGLHFRRLLIRDVSAPWTYEDGNILAKSFGGLATLIDGSATPTRWEDLKVEGCEFRDVSAIGLTMQSSWTAGHRANDPATWFPSRGVVIRGNVFRRIARNGLVVRACAGALVEYNLFTECGLLGSGNASFAFHSDDTVFQFNEACHTKYNPGDHDAAGFDSDYNCRRTVIQYNLSHHNDYGFVLLCVNGKNGFNEDSIVRYNVSYRDNGNVVRLSGPVRGARIHNNTFYVDPAMSNPVDGHPPRVVFHKSWSGWSEDTLFANNLIVNLSERTVYDSGRSTNTRYRNNLFHGRHPASEPADAAKLTVDPQLAGLDELGGPFSGRAALIAALRPRAGSPVHGAGVVLPTQGAADFAGERVWPHAGCVDVGALAFPSETRR